MGHEMSHVRNYDIRLQTIALALAAAISMLVNFAGNFWWLGGRRDDDDNDNGWGILAFFRLNSFDIAGTTSRNNCSDGVIAEPGVPS